MCNPLPLMSKGEKKKTGNRRKGLKAGNRRKGLIKEARQRKTWRKHWIIGGFVAINAKGETVGNIVIDGKGDDKGAPETATKQQ